MKSVLVTGAGGFIGRALTERLAADGARVCCLVVGGRGKSRHPEAENLECDGAGALADALGGRRFDVVYNLAAAGTKPDDRAPDALFEINAAFPARLMAALSRPGRFVQVGSWSEYAPAMGETPIDEDHPLTTSHLYGASKAAGALFAGALAREKGISFAALRLFHVYGPGEPPHRLAPHIIARLGAREGADLTSGLQMRDFVYVGDVIDALAAAGDMESESSIYNVCSGEPVTVRRAAEALADAMDAPRDLLRFGALPDRADETPWMVGDGRRFRAASGWAPRTSLEDGARLTVEAA